MPFIAPIVAAVGSLGAIGSAIVGIGVSVGLSYLSKALGGGDKATTTDAGGFEGSLQIAGDVPRGCIFGERVTEGHLVYQNVSGADNRFLDRVYVVGDGPHDSLVSLWVDGNLKTLELQESTTHFDRYVVTEYRYPTTRYPTMDVWFFHGYEDQPNLYELLASSNPVGRWTDDYRGAGVSYVMVRCAYWKDMYDSIPSFAFRVRGRRLYDWRKDTTAGGDGAQRWGDQATWQYSSNPIVELYNFQRGLFVNGQRLLGAGVAPIDLVLDAYTAGANACDEEVEDTAGFSADRYSCGTIVADSEEYGAVIQRFLDACGGAMYERAGSFSPLAGVAQSTAMTVTDAELVSGAPIKFAAKRGRAELVNGVFGTYTDLSQRGAKTSYPSRVDLDAVAADTEQRYTESDYDEVSDPVQAQRLAELELRLARLQGTANITLGNDAVVLEPGDWLRWTSARYGDRRWLILSITEGESRSYTLDLREISPAAYGEADDIPVNAGIVGVRNTPLATVPDLTPLPRTMTASDGSQYPAIAVYWTPIEDQTVDACIFEYRISGGSDVLQARADDPASGLFVISAGLQGSTLYEVRGTITTTPPRVVVWTDWEPVTTPDMVLSVENLPLTVQEIVNTQLAVQTERFDAIAADLASELARTAAIAENARKDVVRNIVATSGQATARLVEEIAVRATADDALSVQIITLDTEYYSNKASVQTQLTSLSSATSSTASSVTSLSASVTTISAELTTAWVVTATPAGATAAWSLIAKTNSGSVGMTAVASTGGNYITMDADKFLWRTSGGTTFALFDTTGGAFYLRGDLFASGSISASALNVSTLSAISANVGTLTAGTLQSTDGKMVFNLTAGRMVISS